jgi:hypothetical protein
VALVVDVIKDCSRRGEIALDPFAGSGTTVLGFPQIPSDDVSPAMPQSEGSHFFVDRLTGTWISGPKRHENLFAIWTAAKISMQRLGRLVVDLLFRSS